MTRESRSHEYRIESGRSMVEMLGTLAIMGVLSIGGIMGYSYAVDKYHANQIMNDVNLRGIDLIAQASRGGDFSLAEWPTKTSADYDIGLEIDEATNTTEGGIYVNDVEKRICEIIADDLLPENIKLVIDGEEYLSGTCGATNKMVFYYDAIGEALGEKDDGCDGVLNDGVCMDCPENATVSDDGLNCECSEGSWNYIDNTCDFYGCLSRRLNLSVQNPEKVKFSITGNKVVFENDLTLAFIGDVDYGGDECYLQVNGTLTLNGNDNELSNFKGITAKSTTSHGIVLNGVRLGNIGNITAETTANNSYALYMDSSRIIGSVENLDITANGTNGGALYMNSSYIDTDIGFMSMAMIRMKENAGNQVVTGQNAYISGITLMPGSLSIPETEGITLGDIYQ